MVADTEIYRVKRLYSAITLVYWEIRHRTEIYDMGSTTGYRMVEYLKWFLNNIFCNDLELFMHNAENDGWITDNIKLTPMVDIIVLRHDINLMYSLITSVQQMVRRIDLSEMKIDYRGISSRIQQAVDETEMQLYL